MASTTSRTEVNRLFQNTGEKFVTDHADEIPGAERLLKGRGCLEQLGRMIDTEEAATILEKSRIAADALTAGRTVKQVESYLRQGRITGEWLEAPLKDGPHEVVISPRPFSKPQGPQLITVDVVQRGLTTEAATNEPHPNIIEYLTIDDLRGISTYLDLLYECVTKETTVKKLKKLSNKRIEELHEDIDNLNGRIVRTILYTEAQQLKGDSV